MRTLTWSLSIALLGTVLACLYLGRVRREGAVTGPSLPTSPALEVPTPALPAHPTKSPEPSLLHAAEPTPDEAPQRPAPLELSSSPLAWEQQIAAAAARGRDARSRAREIFTLLPRLPEEALPTAAEQAVEHLPDADYAATALPVIIDPHTHGVVLSTLFADLMERPDAIALPALLVIAQNPAHPFAPAALDNLRLLLRTNHGTNWVRWHQAVEDTLAPK